MQARESAPRSPSAVRAHLRPAHQTYRETAAADDPSSNVSHPADKNSILRQPRAPRRLGLAIGGIAGSVFIGTLGAVGYYALSASNTSPRAPQIADNTPQATAADQGASGEVLNQQPANTSWGDQPRKVRTVSIRRDSEDANTWAGESSKNAQSEPNTSAAQGARPEADERSQVTTASTPAAAISDFRSELNTPAPRADTTVDGQKSVRASAAPPQVATRNGVIACQAAAGRDGHWAWRIIDDRKCWYEGKAGMNKTNLQWVPTAD
jgi:hypothetical protein